MHVCMCLDWFGAAIGRKQGNLLVDVCSLLFILRYFLDYSAPLLKSLARLPLRSLTVRTLKGLLCSSFVDYARSSCTPFELIK